MSKKKDKTEVVKDLHLEKKELDNKIMKLNNFIRSVEFPQLSETQIRLLQHQSEYMTKYSMALRDRIIDITSQED